MTYILLRQVVAGYQEVENAPSSWWRQASSQNIQRRYGGRKTCYSLFKESGGHYIVTAQAKCSNLWQKLSGKSRESNRKTHRLCTLPRPLTYKSLLPSDLNGMVYKIICVVVVIDGRHD